MVGISVAAVLAVAHVVQEHGLHLLANGPMLVLHTTQGNDLAFAALVASLAVAALEAVHAAVAHEAVLAALALVAVLAAIALVAVLDAALAALDAALAVPDAEEESEHAALDAKLPATEGGD